MLCDRMPAEFASRPTDFPSRERWATGEREIDAAHAAIIRRIFMEYADGMAPRHIAARLNHEAK